MYTCVSREPDAQYWESAVQEREIIRALWFVQRDVRTFFGEKIRKGVCELWNNLDCYGDFFLFTFSSFTSNKMIFPED
jgi:hypothetical protein